MRTPFSSARQALKISWNTDRIASVGNGPGLAGRQPIGDLALARGDVERNGELALQLGDAPDQPGALVEQRQDLVVGPVDLAAQLVELLVRVLRVLGHRRQLTSDQLGPAMSSARAAALDAH